MTPDPPRTSRKKRWLFTLFVVLLLYGAAEAGALVAFRLADGRAFGYSRLQRERKRVLALDPADEETPEDGKGEVYMPHPYLGMVLNPDYKGRLGGYSPINQFGFCGEPPALHRRSPDKVIVAVTGGSVASMFTHQSSALLARRLLDSPRYAGKKIVFVNLAVPGHKQPQQVMALNYALAMGAEFDLLVNLDGLNEVALYPQDGLAKGSHPLFPSGYWYMVSKMPDRTSQQLRGEIAYLREKRSRLARDFSGSWLRFSVMANLVWRARHRTLASEIGASGPARSGHAPAGLPLCSIGPRRQRPESDEQPVGELVAVWKRCSLQLHRTCTGHGIAYHHFLQPNQYVPMSKPLADVEKQKAWSADSVARPWIEKGYPRLRAAGKELAGQGVKFVDLSMIYAADRRPYYIDPCCHVNNAGHDVLALAIARHILETEEPPR